MMSGSGIIERVLVLYAAAVFVVLWVGAAYALLVDPGIVADAWAWLTGLPILPAILAWILVLPIGVGLWAWQADLAPVLTAIVAIGLVLWTGLAASGLFRAFRPGR
jgi:hypothetical protein